MPLLANIALFQIGWFACVLGAANHLAWAGSVVALAIAGLHLAVAQHARIEARLLLITVALGFTWDSAIAAAGLIEFTSGNFSHALAPYWMAALWLAFATTLNVSLRWLRGHVWLAMAFGAVGGPLAYLAGAKLGALSFPNPTLGLALQAVGWGVLLPMLLKLSVRVDGYAVRKPQELTSERLYV